MIAAQTPSAIASDGLSVRFGAHLVLDQFTLEVGEGSFVAIVGPNGAGKSTFLKTLLGLIEPSEGKVRVFGEPPARVSPDLIGYVPQFKTLDRTFPALAIELVITGLRRNWPAFRKSKETGQAMEILERIGAGHLAYRAIAELSGGELQRVYLARGLVRHPKMILLDEPATGMDVSGSADMYHILEGYQKKTGATVLMITHDWGGALHHATHVLLMNRRMISFGAPGEALREEFLREAFGHRGHKHAMTLGVKSDG